MAIWRGPGGPGDAVPDQANSAQLAENFANAAAASASSVSVSASNAAASAAAALVSESNSSSSASQASASAAAALLSEQAAALSEANALASEQSAALSEANALASEQAAALSESNASTSEANALASEQAAALSESNAASSESNAAASESKAQQWATEAEDVPVETSPTNLYSAFHWAQKSEDFAQTINPTDYVTVANNQTITGVKTFDNGLATDTISEETTAAGVTIDGVLLKDSEVTTDVIKEKTSAAGVTVDGVLLKDAGVVAGAGTVSEPIYSTTGDLNTGIYFPAADTIGFVCGGTEDFRVDGTGQLWNTVESEVGTDYTTLYKGYLCRAWVNFNGTGTVAIRASGNVSSITDNGTGDYTVNFTTAMPDANYSVALTWSIGNGNLGTIYESTTSARTTSSFPLFVFAGGAFDPAFVSVSVFR